MQIVWRQVEALVLPSRGALVEAGALAREAVTIAEPTEMLNLQAEALCDLAEVLEDALRTAVT